MMVRGNGKTTKPLEIISHNCHYILTPSKGAHLILFCQPLHMILIEIIILALQHLVTSFFCWGGGFKSHQGQLYLPVF
uniref:Uncharacterized protein n=1 Tax=Octopus bimaculoides TaxID=37653 RepID=A0A0L8HI69_OCTBM